MSGAQINIKMNADEARAWEAFNKLRRGAKGLEDGLEKISAKSRALGKENARLERAAKKVYESTRTPQERYTQKMKELHQLLPRLVGGHETYRRKVAQLREEYKAARTASTSAFGSGAISQLKSYALGFVGISTAIRGVTAALNDAEQTRREAAERVKSSRMGMGSLAQLAYGDPKKMKALVAATYKTFDEGGAETEDEAARVVYAIESAGALKERKFFAQLRSRGLVESPDVMARSANTMMASLGEKETGGIRPLVSKSFAATPFAPAKTEEILEAAAMSGPSARVLGLHDEELLAATVSLADITGSIDDAKNQLNRMLITFKEQKDFKGLSLREMLKKVETLKISDEINADVPLDPKKPFGASRKMKVKGPEREMTEEDRKKWFGREIGYAGWSNLLHKLKEDPKSYDKALAAINKADSPLLAEKSIAVAGTIPAIKAAENALIEKNRRESTQRKVGITATVADSIQENLVADLERRMKDQDFFGRGSIFFKKSVMNWSRKFGGDEQFVEDFAQFVPKNRRAQLLSALPNAGPEVHRQAARMDMLIDETRGVRKAIEEGNKQKGPKRNVGLGKPDQDR